MEIWFVILAVMIILIVTYLVRRRSKAIQDFGKNPRPIIGQTRSDLRPLVEWLCDQASAETGVSLTNDSSALKRLVKAAEQAVVDLQMKGETEITLPFLTADVRGARHVSITINRQKCRELGIIP